MKKFLSVVLAVVMLSALCATFAVSAESSAEWKPMWVTHYNDSFVEGSGVVFTDAYSGAGWWYHVVFTPVAGSKAAYEITATSDGTPDGNGVAQAIPDGGFVYCLNYGNNYGDVDYTSEDVNNMIADVKNNWQIGDKFVFDGIDFANKTVPTTTPDVKWYEDGVYVCTAQYKVYEPEVDDVVTDDSEEVQEPVPFVAYQFDVEAGTTPDVASGVIFTTSNNTNGWWGQVSFKPVDGGKGWEVVATANPEGTEGVAPLEIPEGGFVLCIYPWSNIDSVRAFFDFAMALEPGAQYSIKGLDLANKTCATDATIAPYVPGAEEEESTTPEAGDASSMIVFAVIALVALAGSAVVVKTRR